MVEIKHSFFKRLLMTKAGVAIIAYAAYCGYANHSKIQRVEETLTKSPVQVEEGFYADGITLTVDTPINESGKREVYLVHTESGKRVPVMYDMFPSNELMLDSLIKRSSIIDEAQARQDLLKINELEKRLYQRLEWE